MAKSRSKRLEVVLNLNQQDLDKISEQLAKQQENLQQEQLKLGQLKDYRDDYMNSVRALKHTNVQQIQSQRGFIQRMQMACDQQQAMVAKVNEHCEAIMQLWQQQSQKLKKLEELIERYQQEEQLMIDKQEQKLIDELSTQKASRRMSSV
ncbi:flagellar export protein FliJ [Pseudoteredinibacter isoporae]|uniref:Flagellar FliJ protein n=1 Tax=Pseudoteredinibacter isoporae TaxID=570281 RepID=A0A7X0MXQ9_9GAMM|nr:flagellar export protein FliJ [Pseudoteredinibacter isoporae]MBB6523470.1 flagellar FliJ protein [Pseudoteredinibacter isoporae]NHO88979.1 flagellar export protein FliJ [Pseudoteredinibacter isoporae]NIB24313.1 flagellar export protein FliJ [Pseudoteredinibacter isoporae]